jgi:hypothetical protein
VVRHATLLVLRLLCRLEAATAKGTAAAGSSMGGPGAAKSSGGTGKSAGGNAAAWDAMNGIAANLLLHLTSSVRFEGTLNTDLNDITMNLVSLRQACFSCFSSCVCILPVVMCGSSIGGFVWVLTGGCSWQGNRAGDIRVRSSAACDFWYAPFPKI